MCQTNLSWHDLMDWHFTIAIYNDGTPHFQGLSILGISVQRAVQNILQTNYEISVPEISFQYGRIAEKN